MSVGYLEDILAQPENLARSHETFTEALQGTDLSTFDADSLVLTGMGSSYFAAMSAACGLRAAGRPAFALSATELLEPGGNLLGAAYVGISQSGKSAETVEGLSRVSAPRLSLTNDESGPLADLADVALPLGSARDTAIATLTYTATLSATAALVDSLGAPLDFDWSRLPALVSETLEESAPVANEAAELFGDMDVLDCVARGSSLASAAESALLLREAVRIPAAYMDTLQYLHGPIEVAEPGRGCIVFGSGREGRLAEDLASYGVAVLLITEASVERTHNLLVLRMPEMPDALAPILQIIPVQLLTYRMAHARGLSAHGFRHEQDDTKLKLG
jgi:glucosamine--fructose-6-phosphate aminotransferase (isomerizing)